MRHIFSTTDPQQTKGLAYLLLACLIWSGWWVLVRHGVTSGIAPPDLLALRLGIAGVLLLPVLTKMGLGTSWPRAIMIGISGGLLNSLLAIYGVQFAPASHGASLMPGVGPVFTAIMAWWLLNEQISRLRWLAFAASFLGAILIGWKGFTQSTEQQWIGDLLFLGAALSWTFYIVCMRLWRVGAWQGTALAAVFGMIIYLPIYSFIFGNQLGQYAWSTLAVQGAYQGILTSVIGFALFNRAIGIFGAAGAGAASALIPVFTVILGCVILLEIPSLVEVLGIALIVCAVPFAMGLLGSVDHKVHDDIEDKNLGSRLDTSV